MAGISVTKADLEGILKTPLSTENYDAVHAAALRLIRTAYSRSVGAASGREADVLDAVYTSVALRLATNPTGARSLGLGGANVTFGGADENFTNVGVLTDDERRDLRSLVSRRPTYVRLRKVLSQDVYRDPLDVALDEVLP